MNQSWWQKMVRQALRGSASRTPRRPLRVEALEDRTTPAGIFAAATEPGTVTAVAGFDAATKAQKFTVVPYEGFTGGVNVAIGDVNGDGTPDVITGPRLGGAPTVNVYSGVDGALLKSLTVGDASSRNGATVAAADYDGDGLADIVVGTVRNGQPLVQVLKFADQSVLRGYTPFGAGVVGASVATGDVDGDGTPDTIIGAGPGGAPQVVVFSGKTDASLMNVFTFETSFTGGVTVSAGDLNADGKADVITAAGFSGGPRVQVFSGATRAVMLNFFAYDFQLRAGVTASAFDPNANGQLDIVTSNGPGQPLNVLAYDGRTLATLTPPSVSGLPVAAAWDTTGPLPTVSSTAAATSKTSPIPFKVTFPEGVNGFALADIQVTNGTASNFVKVDAKNYTFDVAPAAQGAVTINVAAGGATDAAGNANVAATPFSRTFDTTGPVVAANPLTTTDTTPTLTGTVNDATATVSVAVGGQTVTATVAGGTWTATLPTNLAEGTYTISATATDTAGNPTTATATDGLVIDTTPPTVAVTSTAPDPTGTLPIPFKAVFTEDTNNFVAGDVTAVNGTVSNFFKMDAKTYTFDVTPTGTSAVAVSVAAGAATDAAGNGNTASNTVTRTFGTGSIALTAAAKTTNDTTPTLTGTVDDPAAAVAVTVNGRAYAATVTGSTWSADVTDALAAGSYDINVAATGAGTATGSTTLTGGLVVDLTAPAATVSSTATSPSNAASIPFKVTFTEPVTGLGQDDLTVANGTITGFTPVSATEFTVAVQPTADGPVTLTVPAGVAADAAGNPSTAGTLAVTSDRTKPAPTIAATDPANASPIAFTVTFPEAVTEPNPSGVTATNGTVGTITPQQQGFTVEVTPTAAGTVTLNVAAGALQDTAGNANTAGSKSVTYTPGSSP